MKKVASFVVGVAILMGLAWKNRIDVLVYVMPKITALVNKIDPYRPAPWTEGAATRTDSRPNIILILADDLGFNDVSMYGNGSIPTPHIDSIGQDGVIFRNGYAGNAICAPSRASIMTGRYSTRFGFEYTPFPPVGARLAHWDNELNKPTLEAFLDWDNVAKIPENPLFNLGMPKEEVTIAEVLKDAGYYTAHIGKWHLGGGDGKLPHQQGFVDSLNLKGLLYYPEDHPDAVNAKIPTMVDRMVWASGTTAVNFNAGSNYQPNGYLTDFFTDNAVQVIKKNKHNPFFMYLAHWGVHNPLQCTKQDYEDLAHIKDHTHRVYAGMIRAIDRSVEKVLATLKEQGLSDNTMVVFTSDNGGANYLGLPDLNRPYRGWKLSHFEGGTHVPYAAKFPGVIKPGQISDKIVHHTDFFNTFASLGNGVIPTDRKIDGMDLVDVLDGKALGHEVLFWQQGYHASVRAHNWKLIQSKHPDRTWLYNLETDPTEQNNLVTTHVEKVKELEKLLEGHRADQAEPGWASVVRMPILIDKPQAGEDIYVEGDEYIYWPN